jgi:ketosteroid isomerase-like protein
VPARRWLPLAAALLLPASAVVAQPADAAAPRTAQDSIRASILRGAQGFERGDPALILDHYDPSIVLSYPGEPDMDIATLRRAYEGLRDRPRTVVARTVPTFDEILVSGDLAIVRVRWATTIADTAAGRTTSRRLKDMQVWRRRADGKWLFVRGMHYPEPAAADSVRPAPPADG